MMNMFRILVMVFVVFVVTTAGQASSPASEQSCAGNDKACREFAKLFQAEQYDRIVETVEPGKTYSDPAKHYIGLAYLQLAGRETNTPEQEERFCRQALEYGATSAYMGLYFIYAQKDTETALGFLKQYIGTRPPDALPYVILGEHEFENRNYAAANTYLREAKTVGRGYSFSLEWMLFQVNYLLGDHAYAAAMLENVMSRKEFAHEFKALTADPRFSGMEKQPAFRKYEYLFKDAAR